MWDKPWVKWVLGLAALVAAFSTITATGWTYTKPAAKGIVVEMVIDSPRVRDKVIEILVAENAALTEQMKVWEQDLIILRSHEAQTQRTLGQLETSSENTEKNVDLILKLLLEQANKQ